jgi:hypothetical protein
MLSSIWASYQVLRTCSMNNIDQFSSDRGKIVIQHLKNVLCDNCVYDAM